MRTGNDFRYKVTGTDVRGKRFRYVTDSYMQALMINLYRGSVWEKQANGKWKLVHRVYN
tara:strand:- start:7300 stop:7476 length:177 start_codon:yes stop_codon:yes gene_type:complete